MLKEFANQNVIVVGGFSNPASLKLYNLQWPNEPKILQKYMQGHQCSGCTYFAKFNSDYGLCCSPRSRIDWKPFLSTLVVPISKKKAGVRIVLATFSYDTTKKLSMGRRVKRA